MLVTMEQEKSYKHCPLVPLADCLTAFPSAVETTSLPLKLRSTSRDAEIRTLPAPSSSTQDKQWLYFPLGRFYLPSELPSLLRHHPKPILLPKDILSYCPTVSGYPGSKESLTC